MPPAALVIGAGAVSAGAQIMQGIQAGKAADVQAGALERQASYERIAAGAKITSDDAEAAQLLAKSRANAGASGVTQSGSAKTINMASATQARLRDAYTRYGGEAAASNDLFEAANTKWAGKQREIGSFISAGTSMLTSLVSANGLPDGGFLPSSFGAMLPGGGGGTP